MPRSVTQKCQHAGVKDNKSITTKFRIGVMVQVLQIDTRIYPRFSPNRQQRFKWTKLFIFTGSVRSNPVHVPSTSRRASDVTPEGLLADVMSSVVSRSLESSGPSSYVDPRTLYLGRMTPQRRKQFNRILGMVDNNKDTLSSLRNLMSGATDREFEKSLCSQSSYYTPWVEAHRVFSGRIKHRYCVATGMQ